MNLFLLYINSTIHDFTIYHIFLLFYNKEYTSNIYAEIIEIKQIKQCTHILYFILTFTSYIVELFSILFFLEILELKIYGFEVNLKRNITQRGEIETRTSLQDIRTKSDNSFEREGSCFTLTEIGEINDSKL